MQKTRHGALDVFSVLWQPARFPFLLIGECRSTGSDPNSSSCCRRKESINKSVARLSREEEFFFSFLPTLPRFRLIDRGRRRTCYLIALLRQISCCLLPIPWQFHERGIYKSKNNNRINIYNIIKKRRTGIITSSSSCCFVYTYSSSSSSRLYWNVCRPPPNTKF